MTEQPTTPEPIQQSAFPTGRGVCWSAHPNIDGVVPPTQPYQPPARTRPAGWAKTGSVGASATLGSDEEPVTVPARAYDGEEMPVHEPRCDSCADPGHVCENHPDRPWAGVSDDINACHCGGAGMPCPDCCDPIPEDGSTSIGAAFTPRKFAAGGLVRTPSDPADDVIPFPVTRCLYEQPRAEAPVVDVAKPGFGIIGIAEARSWGIEPPPAVELLAMADDLNAHGGYDERFVAGLLRQVIDDDAPSMVNTESMLKIREDLTEEEFEQLRAKQQLGIVGDLPPGDLLIPAGQPMPTLTPPVHRHIWTTTSPMRCVDCRRYLRPWWRRTLDRVRRWGR